VLLDTSDFLQSLDEKVGAGKGRRLNIAKAMNLENQTF
jgi:hypothetical protein